MTSKVILTDVQVLAAGTKIEQDVEGKEPDPGERRHAAGQPRRGRAADARSQRRQDPAGAQEPAGQRHPVDARRQAGGAARQPAAHHGRVSTRASTRAASSTVRPRRRRRRPSRSFAATSARTKSCASRSNSMTRMSKTGPGPRRSPLPATGPSCGRRAHRSARHRCRRAGRSCRPPATSGCSWAAPRSWTSARAIARVSLTERRHRRCPRHLAEPAPRQRQDARHDFHVRLGSRRHARATRSSCSATWRGSPSR